MDMFNKTIWIYWEDRFFKKKPFYLELCLETIKKYKGNYELVILNKKNICDYINFPKKANKLRHLAQKADMIRFQLLYDLGGIWLDCDTILLKKLDDVIDPLIKKHDFLLASSTINNKKEASVSIVVSKKKTRSF